MLLRRERTRQLREVRAHQHAAVVERRCGGALGRLAATAAAAAATTRSQTGRTPRRMASLTPPNTSRGGRRALLHHSRSAMSTWAAAHGGRVRTPRIDRPLAAPALVFGRCRVATRVWKRVYTVLLCLESADDRGGSCTGGDALANRHGVVTASSRRRPRWRTRSCGTRCVPLQNKPYKVRLTEPALRHFPPAESLGHGLDDEHVDGAPSATTRRQLFSADLARTCTLVGRTTQRTESSVMASAWQRATVCQRGAHPFRRGNSSDHTSRTAPAASASSSRRGDAVDHTPLAHAQAAARTPALSQGL